jgi:hypothetical protein
MHAGVGGVATATAKTLQPFFFRRTYSRVAAARAKVAAARAKVAAA